MPALRTGAWFPCMICGEQFYRRRSYIERGIHKTCGKPACKSASMSGENNPYWGKTHDGTTRERIKTGRAANPPKGTGPRKGVFKQSPAARQLMSSALKKRWAEHRDKMMAVLPRGEDHVLAKLPEERRYRIHWTPLQRREWMGDQCAWCGGDDRLILDHIIPVFDGGANEHCNAQTLCRPCNLWKQHYVDRPRYLARIRSQATKGANVNPE